MLIPIDHGNKQIKTLHKTFVSGLCVSDTKPPFGKDVLFYDGKYYTLTDQRIPYMRDKTKDNRYFKTVVFPVPGDPVIMEILCRYAVYTASLCL